jgi:hypothetical protein
MAGGTIIVLEPGSIKEIAGNSVWLRDQKGLVVRDCPG